MARTQPDDKKVVQTLVEKIPEDIPRQTTFRKRKVRFKKKAEHQGPDQESGEWSKSEGDSGEENFPGCPKKGRMTQRRVVMTKAVFAWY